jgi:hypothetical protein
MNGRKEGLGLMIKRRERKDKDKDRNTTITTNSNNNLLLSRFVRTSVSTKLTSRHSFISSLASGSAQVVTKDAARFMGVCGIG